jgi:hypothetical protein
VHEKLLDLLAGLTGIYSSALQSLHRYPLGAALVQTSHVEPTLSSHRSVVLS